MNADVLALLVSAVAGVATAFVSFRSRKQLRDTEVLLRTTQKELSLRSMRSLEPQAVEQRLRALAEVSPDAAVVEAWRTLEAIVGREAKNVGNGPVHGRRVRDVLLAHGYLQQQDAPLLDMILNARNRALHMTESAPLVPIGDYLPVVLQIAGKAHRRAV